MTYTLYHGDCLDILPTLPSGSIDAVIADLPRIGVIVPLSLEMARMAKANEVGEMIRFLWNVKAREARDVMHVKLLAEFLFGNATLLTGVIITLARQAPLTLPVSAIVRQIATTPSGVVCSTVPSVSAVGRTEAEAACTFKRGRDDNMLAAILAIVFGGFLFGRLGCNKPVLSCLLIALARADRYELSTHLERFTGKDFAAHLARMGVAIALALHSKFVGALAATGGLSTPLEALGVGKIGFVADGACAFNHVHDYSMTLG